MRLLNHLKTFQTFVYQSCSIYFKFILVTFIPREAFSGSAVLVNLGVWRVEGNKLGSNLSFITNTSCKPPGWKRWVFHDSANMIYSWRPCKVIHEVMSSCQWSHSDNFWPARGFFFLSSEGSSCVGVQLFRHVGDTCDNIEKSLRHTPPQVFASKRPAVAAMKCYF